MKRANNFKYIQFPLFILRKTHEDFDKTMDYITAYGVYHKSIKHGNSETIDMRVGLGYLNLCSDIPDEVLEQWKTYAIMIDQHYKEIKTHSGKNYPMPNIKVQLMQSISKEDKTTKKIDLFLGYLSVQSILGKRRYFKTNNKHVLARMMGYASIKEIEQIGLEYFRVEKPHLFELYHRYTDPKGEVSKYKMKTFFRNLMTNWRVLKGVDNSRGFYVTMQDKMTVDQLAKVIKANKEKSKGKRLEKEMKEALKRASKT